MQNKKTKLFFISLALLAAFAVGVKAQEKTAADQQAVTVATVNIYRAKIISQNGNVLKISFDLNNRQGIQPNVQYAVRLVQKTDKIKVDEKVYADTVNLGENQTITKEINYTAPTYLSGVYEVWVISRNEGGLPLGQAIAGEVTLKGNGQYVEIVNGSCHLSVNNDSKQYPPLQGVDILSEETIAANCEIKNNFNSDVVIVPRFDIYNRSTFGALITTNKLAEISLKKGEAKQIRLDIPKQTRPQAYDAVLSLERDGQKISNSEIFHYIVAGGSGTIQNLTLDKDYYQQGETSKVSFFWTGPADTFPVRTAGTALAAAVLDITMQDTSGKSCAVEVQKEMANNNKMEKVELAVPIIADCVNPQLNVFLKDKNGNILDKSIIKLISQNAISSSKNIQNEPPKSPKNSNNDPFKYVLVFIMVLLIISVILIVTRKRKNQANKFLMLLLFLGINLVFLTVADGVSADTFTVGGYTTPPFTVGGVAHPGLSVSEGTYSVTIENISASMPDSNNPTAFYPRQTLRATASTLVASHCSNGLYVGTVDVKFNKTTTFVGSESTIVSNIYGHKYTGGIFPSCSKYGVDCSGVGGYKDGMVENAPGSYKADFVGYDSYPVPYPYQMSYTVLPAVCLSRPDATSATMCAGDDAGLTLNTNSTVVLNSTNCTSGTKCEFYCNAGYVKSGNACAPVGPICGDGICNGTDTCSTCAGDCGACAASPVCGDGTCNGAEICSTCASDCGSCPAPASNDNNWKEVTP